MNLTLNLLLHTVNTVSYFDQQERLIVIIGS